MATNIREKYIVDKKGNSVSVIIDIKAYRKMLEELEELEVIRAYDAAKRSGDKAVPFDQAIKEIERSRR